MSVGLKQTVPKCLVSSQVIEKALSAVNIFSWPLTALAIAQQLVTIAQRRRCHDRQPFCYTQPKRSQGLLYVLLHVYRSRNTSTSTAVQVSTQCRRQYSVSDKFYDYSQLCQTCLFVSRLVHWDLRKTCRAVMESSRPGHVVEAYYGLGLVLRIYSRGSGLGLECCIEFLAPLSNSCKIIS